MDLFGTVNSALKISVASGALKVLIDFFLLQVQCFQIEIKPLKRAMYSYCNRE